MNAIEIEEAVSNLVELAFDAAEFPFAFLEAFGNKSTTIRQLRTGHSNKSDIDGGVLQRNHIHLAVCETGRISSRLSELRDSPANAKGKVKFPKPQNKSKTLSALVKDKILITRLII